MPLPHRFIRSRRVAGLLAVLVSVSVGLSGSVAAARPSSVAAASSVAPGGSVPFSPPAIWDSICTVERPAGTHLVEGTNCRWLELDGVWRRYLVYVPRTVELPAGGAWPVVVMLHGNRSGGEQMWRVSGWRQQAEDVGAIVMFPTAWRYERTIGGVGTRWDTWKLPGEIVPGVRLDGYPASSPYPARDTTFIQRMIDDVAAQVPIDRSRVFVAGFSNGGKFAVRVAAALPDTVAAITCAGFCDAPPRGTDIRRNVPMLYGLGTRDGLVLDEVALTLDRRPSEFPLAWSDARPLVWSLLSGHLAAWRLDPDPDTVTQEADRTWVTWRTPRRSNRDGNELRFVLFEGLGHRYPRTSPTFGPGMAAISWEFFLAHPMP